MQGLYRLHVVWCSRHTRKMPHNGREGRGVGGQSSHDQICLLSGVCRLLLQLYSDLLFDCV